MNVCWEEAADQPIQVDILVITEVPQPKFRVGMVYATPGAMHRLTEDEIHRAVERHACGDFGEICAEDRAVNVRAIRLGHRVLSAYRTAAGVKFWVMTSGGSEPYTTVLLPEEY